MLILERFEIQRDRQRLLLIGSLRVPAPGCLFLVGPGGVGKSSLLMALSGQASSVALSWTGRVELDGHSIASAGLSCVYLAQHAQIQIDDTLDAVLAAQYQIGKAELAGELDRIGLEYLTAKLSQPAHQLTRSERRTLAIVARLRQSAPLYLIDEPTADLDEAELAGVRRRLGELARQACLVVATHNRQDCLTLGGRTALIAGGGVQECADSAQFFERPATPAGRNYVENGNCSLPSPHRPESVNGSWWAVPGLLCGMSRPGLMHPIDQQMQGLHALGVRHLVCLEERCTYPIPPVRALGIAHHHYSVADMAPPSFAQAVDMCRLLEPPIRANEGVALHCRGGLGRTGTGLAVLLIWFGDSAEEAIAKVRRAQPLAIQSLAQSRFLYDFADRIRGWHPPVTPTKEFNDVAR